MSAATATVTFSSSTQASLRLRLADGSSIRTVALERASFSTPALTPSAATFDSGLWYNPAEDGRGFMIEVQGSVVVLSSYMYNADGHPSGTCCRVRCRAAMSSAATLRSTPAGRR